MWPESYYCLSTRKWRFSQCYGYLSPDFALKPADLKNITVLTKEKSLPKYSQRGWGQWRPRVIAITALEQYGWGSILRTCNLSCLSVSLYLLFDISALFCPLWAAHSCLAVIWPDDFIVPACFDYRHLVEQTANCLPAPLPAPSLPRSLFLFRSLSQTARPFLQHGEFPIANLLSFWNESSLPPCTTVCK